MVGARGSITGAFGVVAGANNLITKLTGSRDNSSRFGACDIKYLKYFTTKQIEY